ncbi:Non-specific serine/threonine protein kinase [Bertholletia excelsa]
MGIPPFLFLLTLLITSTHSPTVGANAELRALMEVKAALDPENVFLASWTMWGDPCDGSFEGVACNKEGYVTNISLQGKGLAGKLSPAIAGLKNLTGLYLHYNSLYGEIPREFATLTELIDLYLDINNLSGIIPPELGNMASLQVLQLCYNQFTGSIPTELGSLQKLSVLALQSNQLTGAIPASLGDLGTLRRLDLSFNHLFGSIPTRLANPPLLEVLDVRNNSLSGDVPPALKRLVEGFQYGNNPGLCGIGFLSLRSCSSSDQTNPNRPENFEGGTTGLPTREIPETANLKLNCSQTRCSYSSKTPQASVVVAVIIVIVGLVLVTVGILTFSQYRRHKKKPSSELDVSNNYGSTDQALDVYKKKGSPLISLEYSSGWDPLAGGSSYSSFSQEVLQSFRFNLEELESATQYFAEKNLLGKRNFSAIYRGVLRDGSVVAITSINKTSCKSEEAEFLNGLKILTSLRHENIVGLRGFCCSKGRGECFLIYDFVSNGNLLHYLDLKEGDNRIVDWPTRVSIISGIAKGIQYLHACSRNKPALVHQNISAKKVLLDQRFKPLLSDSGLHKLLTNDTVFSVVKACAAMGCLAPEYANTGCFTTKNDIYAFGALVFQIMSGKSKLTNSVQIAAETCNFPGFIDANLCGQFSELEAAKLAKIALMCTHESSEQRPSMDTVVLELGNCS